MSSQFNYELNEKQLRETLLKGEVICDDSLWERFEVVNSTQTQVSFDISPKIPSIDLGISRSIIVPILFVAVIGGLSALLFNFVDFKKRVEIKEEVPYSYKQEIAKTAIYVNEQIKIPRLQVIAKLDTALVADTLLVSNTPTTAIVEQKTPVVAVKPKDAIVVKESIKTSETRTEVKPVIQKKKKAKEVILPTINNNTNLNEGVAEPELELR